jgi:hypothetical protein
MDVMEKPERSRLNPIEDSEEVLANQKRLAKAYREGGKKAVQCELAAMYPEKAAAERKSANGMNAPTSTLSTASPTVKRK